MPVTARSKAKTAPNQLDLFSFTAQRFPAYEAADPIQPNGRDALAGVPAENGCGTGTEGVPRDMLLEAEEKTAIETDDLRRHFLQQGLTAQQAHVRAWEIVRERYIFLPPETQ